MNSTYVGLIILAQAIFSVTDLWKKIILAETPFDFHLLINPRFVLANTIPLISVVIYLWVLARYDLSRSAVTLGVSAVLFSSLLGVVILGEKMTTVNLAGYALAIAAIVLINVR